MNAARLRGLLVDWDGTLLDSFGAQAAATRSALAAHGGDWSPERFVAHPNDWRAHYLGAGVEAARLPAASATYRAAYARQRTRLRPYAKRVLQRLAEAGVALAIVTSGRRDRVLPEIRRHDLADLCGAVVTFDDVSEPKPSPEGLMCAMARLGLAAAATVAVGDTVADRLAAEAAGVRHMTIRSSFSDGPMEGSVVGGWQAVGRRLCDELWAVA
jgi:HAD superfamily hydrolase (TIGR01509 family)